MIRFLVVLTICEQLSPFKEESQVISDESKDHGAVDESSLEQQIHKSANYILIVRKNWSPRPSATRSYSRQAGNPAGQQSMRRNHLSTQNF